MVVLDPATSDRAWPISSGPACASGIPMKSMVVVANMAASRRVPVSFCMSDWIPEGRVVRFVPEELKSDRLVGLGEWLFPNPSEFRAEWESGHQGDRLRPSDRTEAMERLLVDAGEISCEARMCPRTDASGCSGAGRPCRQQETEIGPIGRAVPIEVGGAGLSPSGEQQTEVGTCDQSIVVEIG